MATERLTVVRVPGNGAEDVLIGPKGHVWTATEDGSVFQLTPDGRLVERVATTGGRPLGLELLGDGRVLVCDADGTPAAVRLLQTIARADGGRIVRSTSDWAWRRRPAVLGGVPAA